MERQNCIVRVHRPELTAEERAARMEEIKKATARLFVAVEERRQNGKSNSY